MNTATTACEPCQNTNIDETIDNKESGNSPFLENVSSGDNGKQTDGQIKEEFENHQNDEKTDDSKLNDFQFSNNHENSNDNHQDGEVSEEGEIDEEFEELSNEPEVKEYKKVVRSIGIHLRCTCCGKVYSDPVTLKCGHPIDRDCAALKLRFNQITCPMCRKRDRVASVDDLVTDFDLASQIPPKPRCWFERKQNYSTPNQVTLVKSSSAHSEEDYDDEFEEGEEFYEERKPAKSKKKSKKKKKNKMKKLMESLDANANNNGDIHPSKRQCLSQTILPHGFDASVPPPGFMQKAPSSSMSSSNSISWLAPPKPLCQPSPNPPVSNASSRPLSALERQQLALQEEQKSSIPAASQSSFHQIASHSQIPLISSTPSTLSSSSTPQSNLVGGFSSQPLLPAPSVVGASSTTQTNSSSTNDSEKVNELYNHAYELYEQTLSAGFTQSDVLSGQQYMQFYQQMMNSAPQNMMMNSMFTSFNQWQQYFQQYMQQYMQQFFHQYAIQPPTSSYTVPVTSPTSKSNSIQESQSSSTSLAGGFQLTSSSTPSTSSESAKAPLEEDEKTKYLWVGNLPEGIKAKDIKDLCSPHGRATKIKIVTSKKASMIMAYLTLDSLESAQKIINSLNGIDLKGFTLKVKFIKSNPFENSNSQH